MCVLMSRPLMWKSAGLRAELIRSPLRRAQVQALLPPSSVANNLTAPAATTTRLMQTHGATAALRLKSLLCKNEIVLITCSLTSKRAPLLHFTSPWLLRGIIGLWLHRYVLGEMNAIIIRG